MKNILIIEDDSFKADSLSYYFEKQEKSYNISLVGSLSEATEIVNEREFDLILVDMAIPSHPSVAGGGSPTSLLTGGIDVLLELNYLNRSDPCVVVTQYPDIKIADIYYSLQEAPNVLKSELGCEVIACIEFKEDNNTWESTLNEIVNKI
ncbi:MAG: response regulator [Vibrio casei]|uniref:response regulator n=1 Tax=Vibrio casei TaxID=673372 RepID=UPI003F9AF9C2